MNQTTRCMLLLLLPLFFGVGCMSKGHTVYKEAPWKRAYDSRDIQLVVDRFEIDVRNTEAIKQLDRFAIRGVTIAPDGSDTARSYDIEIFATDKKVAEAIRKAPKQQTLRRTIQRKDALSNISPRLMELPAIASKEHREMTLASESRFGVSATPTFEIKKQDGYEEGIELTIRSTALSLNKAEPDRRSEAIEHDIQLFLQPRRTLLLRTNPDWPKDRPALLRYAENGQQYVTVYLITYVYNR